MELIEEVIGLVRQQNQEMRPPVASASSSDQRRSITEFRKMAPPAFKGTTDPQEAEAWIDEMEKAFRAMDCTEEERVRFSSYMLQDRAHHWWKSVERTLTQGPEPVTWQGFRTAFYSKYFPPSRIRELEREFMNLSQGVRSVDDYEAEFDRLSRFAPALVSDPQSRMRRFEEGLKPHLRRGLAAVHAVDYDDLVDRAKNMEIIWKETLDARNVQPKRDRDTDVGREQNLGRLVRPRPSPGQRRPPGQAIQPVRSKCGACGGAHRTEQCRKLSGACFKCGQQGHRIAECPQSSLTSVTCYKCGQQGHRFAECPQSRLIFVSCYKCGQQGHKAAECSQFRPIQRLPGPQAALLPPPAVPAQAAPSSLLRQQRGGRPRTQGRVYALTQQDAQTSNTVVTGTLPVSSAYAHVLFDSGATHSFISSKFVHEYDMPCSSLDWDLYISTPAGGRVIANQFCQSCPIHIEGSDLTADLIVMDMHDFDVILGMDWLTAVVDFRQSEQMLENTSVVSEYSDVVPVE